MTLPRVVICIGCIWVQGGALSMAPLLGWNEFYFNPNRAHCSFSWNKEGYHIFYVAMIGVLCFALPALIVIFMYCGIFRVARKAARQVGPLPAVNIEAGQSAEESTGTENRQERGVRFSEDRTTNSTANENIHADAKPHCCRPFNGEFKALKTLLLIVGTFLLLWSPYFAVNIHGIIYRQIGDALIWERVTTWIAYCSFAVNPYVYGWLNKLLRQELIKTFRNCSRCRENATSDAEEQIGEGEDFYQFLERTSTRTTSLYTRSTDMGREQSVAPIKIVEVSEIENN
ncbi:G-protein coupled receptor 61-like [Ptychodera flava]